MNLKRRNRLYRRGKIIARSYLKLKKKMDPSSMKDIDPILP